MYVRTYAHPLFDFERFAEDRPYTLRGYPLKYARGQCAYVYKAIGPAAPRIVAAIA